MLGSRSSAAPVSPVAAVLPARSHSLSTILAAVLGKLPWALPGATAAACGPGAPDRLPGAGTGNAGKLGGFRCAWEGGRE